MVSLESKKAMAQRATAKELLKKPEGGSVLFDPRRSFWKEPFGPLRQAEQMELRLILSRSMGACRVSLVVFADDGSGMKRFPMFFCALERGREVYECRCALQQPGLYWYRFEYEGTEGLVKIGKGPDGRGRTGEDASWQLTVYERDFHTPEALKGGVMYQIFPDRFYRSPHYTPRMRKDAVLREDWGGIPRLERTPEGRVPNNDFFGGNLKGIQEKLDYLSSLGVNCLYLNPIFEAASNHKYDTGDYESIDGVFGTEEDFVCLCREAKARGIRILLDGVFNHTGSDSRYFNRYGRYEELGAYQSVDSPYYEWYHFTSWPDAYDSWWGVDILPQVNEEAPSYLSYITGEKGILHKWLSLGAGGFRLDVADELPDGFLDRLRERVKKEDPENLIIGEVWEDASNKISYGKRRRYLQGRQLDSVMNYVFRDGIIAYALGGKAQDLAEKVEALLEHYPKECADLLMNILGTHDTRRILTVLSEKGEDGRALLKNAAVLQFFLPGLPCVYYGDEAGMTGEGDPYCRGCFPWGHEDLALVSFYRKLGGLRRSWKKVLARGSYETAFADEGAYGFYRRQGEEAVGVFVNMGENPVLLWDEQEGRGLLAGQRRLWQRELLTGRFPGKLLWLPPRSAVVLGRERR